MSRAQCIVYRIDQLLMVRLNVAGETWWCLPGGAIEPGETPAQAALRELQEECRVHGAIVEQVSHQIYSEQDQTYTFWVDIGDQVPQLGTDPEFEHTQPILVEMQWLKLSEIPERDRAYLWWAGLMGVPQFWKEVSGWGDLVSYPGLERGNSGDL